MGLPRSTDVKITYKKEEKFGDTDNPPRSSEEINETFYEPPKKEKSKKKESQFERDELLMIRKAITTQLSAYKKYKDKPNSIIAMEYPEFEKLKEKIQGLLQ